VCMVFCLAALLSFPIQPPAQQPAAQSSPPPFRPVEPMPVSPEKIDALPISLDKIKKGLDEAPEAPSTLRIGELPTFRIKIEGRRKPMLPDFQETLRMPWQAPIPGGIHNKEILDMITPPQARPFGAFTNGDLAEVAATSIFQALFTDVLVKGLTRGVRTWQEWQIRREVEEELEAFKRANGIVDTPLPPPTVDGAPPNGTEKPPAPQKPPEVKPPGL